MSVMAITEEDVKKIAKLARIELTEDEIVGSISVSTSDSRRDTFNAVKGIYSEPTSLYQSQTYAPVTNSLWSIRRRNSAMPSTARPTSKNCGLIFYRENPSDDCHIGLFVCNLATMLTIIGGISSLDKNSRCF